MQFWQKAEIESKCFCQENSYTCKKPFSKKKKEAKYYLLIRALINKDDHKDNYKEIIEKLVKERFDKIKELSSEINDDDLKYYFKRYTARKRFDDFNNAIELFRNI